MSSLGNQDNQKISPAWTRMLWCMSMILMLIMFVGIVSTMNKWFFKENTSQPQIHQKFVPKPVSIGYIVDVQFNPPTFSSGATTIIKTSEGIICINGRPTFIPIGVDVFRYSGDIEEPAYISWDNGRTKFYE